jgi:hypothetical protein
MSFYFLTEFFKYFFRVLHEASSSWLKFLHAFQKHPVYTILSSSGSQKKIEHKLTYLFFVTRHVTRS